jgi:hypothetical protein
LSRIILFVAAAGLTSRRSGRNIAAYRLAPCPDYRPQKNFIKADQDETFSNKRCALCGVVLPASGDSMAFKGTDAEKPTVCQLDGTFERSPDGKRLRKRTLPRAIPIDDFDAVPQNRRQGNLNR